MSLAAAANPDNANPVIHKTSSERRPKLGDFLDEEDAFDGSYLDGLNDGHGDGAGFTFSGSSSGSSNEVARITTNEDIDANEIYGQPSPLFAE